MTHDSTSATKDNLPVALRGNVGRRVHTRVSLIPPVRTFPHPPGSRIIVTDFPARTSRIITFFGVPVVTEDRLSDVLSEFARTLVTDFPIQGILDHLVLRIVDVLPIEAAGVSLISPPRIRGSSLGRTSRRCATSSCRPHLGEGPCLAAFETDEPISIPDLAEDDRFPQFAARRAGGRPGRGLHVSRCATRVVAWVLSTSTARRRCARRGGDGGSRRRWPT